MSESLDPPLAQSFEQALAELELIVRLLEDGEVGLAEALGRYEQGVKLLKQCYAHLERAERKIELLTGVDAQGNPVAQPFDESECDDLEQKAQARSKRRSAGGRKSAKASEPGDDETEQGGLFS